MHFSARRFLVFFVTLIAVFVFSTPSYAQNTTVKPQDSASVLMTNSTSPDVPSNIRTLTQSVMLETVSGIACQLAGIDPLNPSQQCLGVDPKTGVIGFVQNGGGAVGVLTHLIASLFNPPAHSYDYFAYLGRNFGITKSVYAAQTGDGFTSISGLVNIWTQFRNIAYLLFIVVFILIGIAIMLRTRINPQTVMTIQNQIPRLIIGIILVTFSFAIAGFLIDLMWLVTYLVINVLVSTDPKQSVGAVTGQLGSPVFGYANSVMSTDFMGGIFDIAQKSAGSIQTIITSFFGGTPGPATSCSDALCTIGSIVGGIFGTFVGILQNIGTVAIDAITLNLSGLLNETLGTIVGGILGFVISWIAAGIAFFIIIIAIIWALFKLWFALLKAYIFAILDIIFAPLWIIAGLIPGSGPSAGFGAWLRDLASNLAVFPAIAAYFVLAKVILDDFEGQSTIFIPPLIGNASFTTTLGPLIALGFILSSPGVVEAVKKAFKATGIPLGFGGLTTGQAVMAAIGGAVWGRMYYRWRNPNTGQMMTGGPVGTRLTQLQRSITNSRFVPRRYGSTTGRQFTGTAPAAPTTPAPAGTSTTSPHVTVTIQNAGSQSAPGGSTGHAAQTTQTPPAPQSYSEQPSAPQGSTQQPPPRRKRNNS